MSLHACACMFIVMNTQYHMNKKEILLGHSMDKAIRVTLLSDALPQRLRHLWAIIRDLALSVTFKAYILKKRAVHYASFLPKYFQSYNGRHFSL